MSCKITRLYWDQIMAECESSNNDETPYLVNLDVDGWFCNCPDYIYRRAHEDNGKCKHIREVEGAIIDAPITIPDELKKYLDNVGVL